MSYEDQFEALNKACPKFKNPDTKAFCEMMIVSVIREALEYGYHIHFNKYHQTSKSFQPQSDVFLRG